MGAVAVRGEAGHGPLDGRHREWLDPGVLRVGAAVGVERRGVEGVQVASIRPYQHPEAGLVEGHRARAGQGQARHDAPGREVVRDELRAGRHPDAVAGPVAGPGWFLAARLDRGVPHGHAQVARGGHVVPREGDDPGGHRVLGEVWMGPLVDVVGDVVAPGLQELGGGARVVDLIEMHPGGVAEPVRAQDQRTDHEHDQEEQVQPVQAASWLAVEARRSVRAEGRLAHAGPQPRDGPHLRPGRPVVPGGYEASRGPGGRAHGCRAHGLAARGRNLIRARSKDDFGPGALDHHGTRDARGGNARLGREQLTRLRPWREGRILDPAALQLGGKRPARARTQLEDAPDERRRVEQGHRRHAERRSDRAADPQPVRDPRVVRVERDEDHVHVQERGDPGHDVGDPPAGREREQDRRQAEEREQVPLVDARRRGEEGQGEHADADQDRQAVRMARHHPGDDRGRAQEQRRADQRRRNRADRPPGGGVRHRGVRHPERPAGRGHALAVHREQRPPVVGVHREIRVGRRRAEHQPQEGALEEGGGRRDPDDREPERRRQRDGGQEPRCSGGQDAQPPDVPELEGEPAPGRLALVAVAALRPQRPPDHDDGHDRHEDRQLRLDEGGDHREDGGPLTAPPPQLAHAEEQEQRPEAVHLAPDHRVEPGDRVEDDDRGGDQRAAPGHPQLQRHGRHEVAEQDVRDDRR